MAIFFIYLNISKKSGYAVNLCIDSTFVRFYIFIIKFIDCVFITVYFNKDFWKDLEEDEFNNLVMLIAFPRRQSI